MTKRAGDAAVRLAGVSIAAAGAIAAAMPQAASAQQATTQQELSADEVLMLDPVTVLATRTEERAIDALAAVSVVTQSDLNTIMPTRPAEVFKYVPGVSFSDRGDDPGSSINIRGLQDFGRVAVIVDGARQNFQRSGHGSDGQFYLDPEMLSEAEVVRGPVANIYGSGAIGGVVSFTTKDTDDILRPGERWGALANTLFGTNRGRAMGSLFGAVRPTDSYDVMVGASYRTQDSYDNGNGAEVAGSGNDIASGLAKATFRPADGHEVKFSGLTNRTDYEVGQSAANASAYDTKLQNDTASMRWRYSKPEDRLFDFEGSVYWNRTDMEQIKVCCTSGQISGTLGVARTFAIDTAGFDLHNTTRIDTGSFRHAFTYGADFFNDQVETSDPTGASDLSTPSGERSVYGGFLQWKLNHADWFELITAARYDGYELSGGGNSSEGDRISPKITLGITPLPWLTVYGTYAEGYRAPAVTETLVAGAHPGYAPGIPSLFTFVPNPGLQPEVGKTKEIGFNIRKDDLFSKGDALRAKINVFRNDVENYIEIFTYGDPVTWCPVTFPGCPPVPLVTINDYSLAQYRNVPEAMIEGFEFEGRYDAGAWYLGLTAQWMEGRNVNEDTPLLSIPSDRIVTVAGIRLFDRKVTLQASWTAARYDHVPDGYTYTAAYNLVDIYVGYQPNPDVLLHAAVTNLLDEYYLPNPVGQPDMILATAAPGLAIKGGLKIRFGG
ncbi:TonB-dependent hemoglobin/transferrin/lactoferrin family receptor [Blastochloris sulfoviridis]|uniref:TonB-dependent hemoglobin/transferrin/lactoferrin family receptor n=1 Tax=Blastochloris sulfoviridis TaxID=50712 RepID=A0A5M6I1B4_9HYPH|nr:TonB-dependent hemoglobin/transferrin/lactoferrin family receptor [Blastochloris sulfoviridis]KAA5601974.1 TonB-dependent hemoglobin/transferrin/lactoferrin family receptor [Blastochloris sulfoviridis]